MQLRVDIGVKASFLEIYAAQMNESVRWRATLADRVAKEVNVGARLALSAKPEMYGSNYAGIAVSWGCFDAYTYEVDDPHGLMDEQADKQLLVMTVPTGGCVTLMSSSRYNAMAKALGTMPEIEVPYAVGQLNTYPTWREKLTGQPIDDDELLFADPGVYHVSPVGDVAWWLSIEDVEANTEITEVAMGAAAGITVNGVQVGMGTEIGWGKSYTLAVGSRTLFYGKLPPMPDDPLTPEDEYSQNAYAVEPLVYLERFRNQHGESASYFVHTYAVHR